MSTKSKRASTATPQPPHLSGTSTPLLSGSNRPSSPLSPTKHSRLQEKAELQNLNDRLACYIDRVRNLETENARLSIEINTTRENIASETTSIKHMYENELGDARRLLDETSREKAKLEIDYKRRWEENEELKTKLDKKTKELLIAEGNARMYETRAADLNNKYIAACSDRNKATEDLNDLQKEFDRLRSQLEEVRKNLEDETLARVDLENNIQSLREELTFKDQVHLQEVNESRTRRQTDITEIDGRLSEQYEAKLQQSLQELRDQYESQMRANRDEIEKLYDAKIKNIQASANRNSNAASSAIEELRSSRSRMDTLNSRINELEMANAALISRIRDSEQLRENEQARNNDIIANLQAELQTLRDSIALQLQEYQDLMDIKVSLDLEIAAYDKLLGSEESRLNITPSNVTTAATVSSLSQLLRTSRGTPTRKTPSRGSSSFGPIKRKRTALDESEDISQSEYFVTSNATGDIEIAEVDGEGKFVKLYNKGSKEVNVGGWQLIRSAGGNETTFKLHRSVKINGGGTITIWSSNSGASHDPPSNIVMKTQKWFVADSMKTFLTNADGDEVAASERVKRTVSTHMSRHRMHGGRLSASVVDSGIGGEHLYHQQNDPLAEGTEKCCIM